MAGMDPAALGYRQMLVKLDQMIRPDELARMKMFCKDFIGTKNRDKIQSGTDLFEKLEERNYLSRSNLTFLKRILAECTDGRQDVQKIVADFETHGYRNVTNGNLGRQGQQQEDLSAEIRFLVNNLGRDWKFFMRSLGVTDAVLEMCVDSHPRNVREQIQMAFKEWQDDGKADKNSMLRALKEVHRNDLHQKLNNMVAN
ncbi:hypothetical protein BaRGS_00001117 [Batillaria attramentaria]|uniref:FADD n=1 Tax=Batillaria attramentaria TaxID=370345 RepID=A0ABD0M6A0_9CAEN